MSIKEMHDFSKPRNLADQTCKLRPKIAEHSCFVKTGRLSRAVLNWQGANRYMFKLIRKRFRKACYAPTRNGTLTLPRQGGGRRTRYRLENVCHRVVSDSPGLGSRQVACLIQHCTHVPVACLIQYCTHVPRGPNIQALR